MSPTAVLWIEHRFIKYKEKGSTCFLGALEIKNCPTDTAFTAKFFVEYADGATLISPSIDATYTEPVQ